MTLQYMMPHTLKQYYNVSLQHTQRHSSRLSTHETQSGEGEGGIGENLAGIHIQTTESES